MFSILCLIRKLDLYGIIIYPYVFYLYEGLMEEESHVWISWADVTVVLLSCEMRVGVVVGRYVFMSASFFRLFLVSLDNSIQH